MRLTSKISKIFILAFLAIVGLSACGGGAGTSENAPSGLQATEEDFLAKAGSEAMGYYNEVWKNLSDENRCGKCHNAEVGQAPQFVDANDNELGVTLNDNHKAVRPYVNLASTNDSILVTKVRNGHKPQACWLATEADCADAIRGFLDSWNNLTNTTQAVASYILTAPSPLRDVANTKKFPVSSTDFASLHTLLQNNCSTCHASPTRQGATGSFASSDRDQAYQEAQQKIDLLDPANSRLVYRLREQSHNCWPDPDSDPLTREADDCVYSSQEMENAITAFANTITDPTPIDSNLIISKAMKLQPPEAIVVAGGERHISNQIALWEFKKGSGNTAFDTSNVEPLMHLTMSGDYNWVGGNGIQFRNGQAQASFQTSQKLIEEAELRQEYSIEAWVIPSVESQRKTMISYSGSTSRNFTFAQYDDMYQANTRSVENLDGNVEFLRTADADVQISQQHIVVTYDPVNGNRIYVNGVFTDDIATHEGAIKFNDDTSVWNDRLSFILGNEVGSFDGSSAWQGIFRMVAIHNRALSPEQIDKNFQAGVGEKFFLLFNIEDVDGVPADSYIKMQAEQFDTYSYLFSNPIYVNLGNPVPATINIPIAGMRIGINGKEATVAQSFTNIGDPLVITTNFQEISKLGTMVEVQQGTQVDDFFLTFETLGTENNPFALATPANPAVPADLDPHSEIGVRTFSEINATMSDLTGVPTSNTTVANTYNNLIQQLPPSEDINAFVPAHIIGISQLAYEYCDQLVENTEGNRAAYFGSFNFSLNVDGAFNAAGDTTTTDTNDPDYPTIPSDEKKLIVNSLYDRMIGIPAVALGSGISNAPTRAEIMTELVDPDNNVVGDPFADPVVLGNAGNLFDRLYRSCGSDDPDNNQVLCSDNTNGKGTKVFVKAMCSSVLGSAAMLIQ